jgi:hypothetical protein
MAHLILWQCIPALMDGNSVLTTHRFAAGVNSPDLGLNALSEAYRLTVGDVNHSARTAHAHAGEHDPEDRA